MAGATGDQWINTEFLDVDLSRLAAPAPAADPAAAAAAGGNARINVNLANVPVDLTPPIPSSPPRPRARRSTWWGATTAAIGCQVCCHGRPAAADLA
ncbi:MAG: hypothetical protein R2838_08355 [Caldilineaceae bacterium]